MKNYLDRIIYVTCHNAICHIYVKKLNWDFSRLVFWLFNYCDELSSRNFHCGCFYRFLLIWFLLNTGAAEIYAVIFYFIVKNIVFWRVVLFCFDLWHRDASIYSIKSFIWVSDSGVCVTSPHSGRLDTTLRQSVTSLQGPLLINRK